MNLFQNVHESWIPLLHSLAYEKPLVDFLNSLNQTSYQPKYEKIFKVFEMPVQDIKLVILGQDPYPIPGSATGIAYAVPENNSMPVILRNIEKEVYSTEGIRVMNDDNDIVDKSWKTLNHWIEQGVFLFNIALTVETGNAGSHMIFWKKFTERVISYISEHKPCIWMLWGKQALNFSPKIINPLVVKGYDKISIEEVPIDPKLNYIIPGEHPIMNSVEGKGFSNNGFYYTNRILEKRSLKKITW